MSKTIVPNSVYKKMQAEVKRQEKRVADEQQKLSVLVNQLSGLTTAALAEEALAKAS